MKRNVLWIVGVLLVCGGMRCRAEGYDELWKQVKQYERHDLPKSALEVVERIAGKADREQHKGQRMAALLYGCKLRQGVVPDSFYTDILKLERLKRQAADGVEAAVLASVLGGLYADNVWRNRNDSPYADAHPDSVREWSAAQFREASKENYLLSMAHPDLLAAAKAADYLPFVEQGKDAAVFRADLLNVVGRRAVAALGKADGEARAAGNRLYGEMLAVYRRQGNREAELLLLLDSVGYARTGETPVPLDGTAGGDSPATRERQALASSAYAAYRRMLSRFGDLPMAAEVYLRMLDLDITDSLRVRWAAEGYEKYEDYPRVQELLNRKKALEAPRLSLRFPALAHPDMPFECVVEHRNLSGMELLWYLVPEGSPERKQLQGSTKKGIEDYVKKYGRLQKTERLDWVPRAAWVLAEDTFRLSCPGTGAYVVLGKADGAPLSSGNLVAELASSRLEVVGGILPDSTALCTVVDGRTGAPVADAEVDWLYGDEVFHTARTDAQGKARWDFTGRWAGGKMPWSISFRVRKGDDRSHPGGSCVMRLPFREKDEAVSRETRLYVDRSVYRPGQTVHVGGICWDERHDGGRVAGGRQVKLALCDRNGQTVDGQTVETDAMGTFSAEFILPATGLPGLYSIRTDNARTGFAVEEYKRPAFEVRLDKVDGHFRGGDTLQLAGEAVNYNGVPLRRARVSAVSSLVRWYYRTAPQGGEAFLLDTVLTDEHGRFVLKVPVCGVQDGWNRSMVRQQVEVSVTSAAGETQTARTSFPLTPARIRLAIEMPCYMLKDSLPCIEAKVLAFTGAQYTDSVVLSGDIYRVREGKPREKVVSGLSFAPNKAVRPDMLSMLLSGHYELSLQAMAEGDSAVDAARFVLFSLSDTRLEASTDEFFYCINDTVSPGSPARMMVGSGADSVSLYYMLFCENRVLEEKLYRFSDSILTFVYPEIPQGADGMQAVFYYVKAGRLHAYRRQLVRRQSDSGLRMSWVTFRDRLRPGAEETWKLRVTLPDGRPAPAQLMSVLYDASLDGIRPHGWSWNRYRRLALPNVRMDAGKRSVGDVMSYSAPVSYSRVRDLSFDRFSPEMTGWRYYVYTRNGDLRTVAGGKQAASAAGTDGAGEAPVMAKSATGTGEEAVAASDGTYAGTATLSGGEEPAASRILLRDDLRETAFFYPRLRADSAGVVTIRFTLPEGLTTWKFMALAHTEDLHAATFADEAVAQKEVMAQLNLPRFVRMGDRATLSTSLFNLTGKPLEGAVGMEVFDPATERVLWKETMRLTVGAETDTVVAFAYEPEEGVSLPACRVLFEAGGHADGEQRYLPVLEDKEWLVQTHPFVVAHKGDTVIRLDGLFQDNHPQADRRRLTVEYTAHPLWYAVLVLPSVLEPPADDVLSLAAAYYAATLSSRLAVRYPQMKAAVDAWRNAGGKVQESPLSVREDLSGIVLEETPWVADAEAGTRRMGALQLLFDANRGADLRRRFAEALGRLQRADGSFGWFEGMPGNAYLTRRVARLLLRSGAGRETDSILALSVNVRKMSDYLADEAHREVQEDKACRAEHKTYRYGAAHWAESLYLMQLCGAPWSDAGYMLARLVEGMHGLEPADKAEAAVVLYRLGRTDEASQLVRSLREHLVEGTEGLHLEYPSNGFAGPDRKMAVHTMVMEAFGVAGGADKAVSDGLCRWLLAQKRLQAWGNSVESMDAVYALLQGQGGSLSVQVADRVRLLSAEREEWAVLQSATDGEAGLGLVSATVEGRELADGAGLVEVVKTQDTPPSWGAAYAQFRLPLAEVGRSASGLQVRVETDQPSPAVGDRLTLRYVVTADRDYEYVRLKAGRAACLEPVDARSGYRDRNGLGYYREVRDASTGFYFERLPKGTYVLEEECYVERAGRYAVGAARLNGVYAPEFGAYGAGPVLEVRP